MGASCGVGRGGALSKAAPPNHFIVESTAKVDTVYECDLKKLGNGAFGSVSQARHRSTAQVRAIKTMRKSQMGSSQEVSVLKIMDHPNVVKLFEIFEDRTSLFLVMELCTGGELFERIIAAGSFPETTAALVMRQLLSAVNYMHDLHLVHRDLKPENFLLLTEAPIETNILKVIDFGLASRLAPGEHFDRVCGSPGYVAPQVLSGCYDHMCDLWSCGVVMYVLLCGGHPFQGHSDSETLRKVHTGKFAFKSRRWEWISDDAKDLVSGLLTKDPKRRLDAKHALQHVWTKNTAPRAKRCFTVEDDLIQNLRSFRLQNRLKQAALHALAGQLNDSQIQGLRTLFESLDADSNGLITLEELQKGILQSGLKEVPADLQEILDGVDTNRNREIDYTEFLAAGLARRKIIDRETCWSAFHVFDLDHDGKITVEELRKVLGTRYEGDQQSLDELIASVDRNGDREISFEEFYDMMRMSPKAVKSGVSNSAITAARTPPAAASTLLPTLLTAAAASPNSGFAARGSSVEVLGKGNNPFGFESGSGVAGARRESTKTKL